MTHWWLNFAAVAFGALIGSAARFFLSGLIARHAGETFPWGTLVVNISGSFLVGACAAYAQCHGLSSQSDFWLLVVTGILGSYTTVSSFSLQTRALFRDGEQRRAFANVFLSVGLCVFAAAAGFSGVVHLLGPLPA